MQDFCAAFKALTLSARLPFEWGRRLTQSACVTPFPESLSSFTYVGPRWAWLSYQPRASDSLNDIQREAIARPSVLAAAGRWAAGSVRTRRKAAHRSFEASIATTATGARFFEL